MASRPASELVDLDRECVVIIWHDNDIHNSTDRLGEVFGPFKSGHEAVSFAHRWHIQDFILANLSKVVDTPYA